METLPETLTDKQISEMTEFEFRKEVLQQIGSIAAKVDPMYEIFSSVNGFNRVAVWVVKILAAVGTILVGLYAVIEFFRRLSK